MNSAKNSEKKNLIKDKVFNDNKDNADLARCYMTCTDMPPPS